MKPAQFIGAGFAFKAGGRALSSRVRAWCNLNGPETLAVELVPRVDVKRGQVRQRSLSR